MPYLNLDVNYFDHIKTVRLIGLLGHGAAELPIRLWAHCGKHHAKDGNLAGYSLKEIEATIGWWGKKGEAIKALERVGFIEKVKEGYKVHEWQDHEGHLKNFHERAKTAAARRWGKMLGDATSIATEKSKQCPIPTIPSLPNQPDQTSTTTGEEYSAAPGKTATALEEELTAVGYKKPDPKLEPERALACAYRQIRKIPKKSWARWDQEHLAAFKPKARALIDLCGSLMRANDCLHDKAAEFEAKNFKNWTITGVVNNADQWITSHPEEGIDVRTHDRKSISVPPTERERARSAEGLRKPASAAEILAGVRDMPDVPVASELKNGTGNPGHEQSRGGVQRTALETADSRIQSGESGNE